MRTGDIENILKNISFSPSCIDMAWEWEISTSCFGQCNNSGWLIRTTFQRPDRDTGKIGKGYGRWWHLNEDITESGVVKTAFAAAELILKHELMESFKFKNQRPFDPHADVNVLCKVNER